MIVIEKGVGEIPLWVGVALMLFFLMS